MPHDCNKLHAAILKFIGDYIMCITRGGRNLNYIFIKNIIGLVSTLFTRIYMYEYMWSVSSRMDTNQK